jgi:hypothetical protein
MKRALVVVAGVAVTGFGIWVVGAQVGTHITGCGFDAHGAYAKVHASPLGESEVWVDFYVDGMYYNYRGAYDVHGTTVVRAPFPLARAHISGRTVYTDISHGHGPLHFVTKQYADTYPGKTWTETVPDNWHTLSCRLDNTNH